MHGNLWQWVQDCYQGNYNGAPNDGTATKDPPSCALRVVRGGSYNYDPWYLRSVVRDVHQPGFRSSVLGFRVARTLLTP